MGQLCWVEWYGLDDLPDYDNTKSIIPLTLYAWDVHRTLWTSWAVHASAVSTAVGSTES